MDQAKEYNPETFDPVAFKIETEKMLRKIRQPEEVQQSPRAIARDMIYDAMDMPSGRARKALAEEALAIYPHLGDAWIIIAEEVAPTYEESLFYFMKAVQAGERDLGEDFFKNNAGRFWGIIESRPYMRAKACLSETLWELGFEDEAIQHDRDCLRLNPNDNQGLRYILIQRLLIKNDLKASAALLKKYNETFGPFMTFSKALLLYKQEGSSSKPAKTQLKKAIKTNPHVPSYLLGSKKMPKALPASYASGSTEEAITYADVALRAWHESPGALIWLAQNI
jgi:tetratricopeptide (TPR) repeat protein